MSAVCPNGHTSEATDYCDVCGARIGGDPAAAAPAPTPPPAAAGSPAGAPAPTRTCPNCQATNDPNSRYCEQCGYDFVTGALPPALTLPPTSAPASPTPGASDPAPPAIARAAAPVTAGWEVAVRVDHAYYTRNDIDSIPFPAAAPERVFALTADRMVIGRHSTSKGINPEIDLASAPQDPAVSHVHAVLTRDADRGWMVVDPGSANGTYVNDGSDRIPENTPVPLEDGDEIHIGAWTTLTLHKTGS